jgi:hypothetical protein
MTDTQFLGLTVEDLPFGVEPPVGMPTSVVAEPVYDPIPYGLDVMPPGLFLAVFLSLIDVSKLSGHDQIVVLRAHHKMASYYQAASYQDMAALSDTMLTFDGYPQTQVEAAEMAAAEIRVALNLTRHSADERPPFKGD